MFYCYYLALSTGTRVENRMRHLKTKFTPLNRAVRSLSTHPVANLAAAVESLSTWRGEHVNFPLCSSPSLSLSLLCCISRSSYKDTAGQSVSTELFSINSFFCTNLLRVCYVSAYIIIKINKNNVKI